MLNKIKPQYNQGLLSGKKLNLLSRFIGISLALFIVFSITKVSAQGEWITYTTADGLANNNVKAIIESGQDTIWFGTNGGGLSKFFVASETWQTYDTSNSGLVDNKISSIIKDNLNNLWFGTNAGVSKFDGTTWTTYDTSDGLANNTVHAILQDIGDTLWFGTQSGGVSKYDGTTWTTYDTTDGLVHNDVLAIYEDIDGNLWFGTNGGVSKYDHTSWTTYDTLDGLAYNSVCAIVQDIGDTMWFGTFGGVSKFDGTTWTTYDTSDGLGHNIVFAIIQDSQNNLWFGTFGMFGGGGTSKYDHINWLTYTDSDGLANNTVYAIAEDNQNNIWFGTMGGVSKLIPTLKIIKINFNNISCYGANDGSITINTYGGEPPIQYSIDGGSFFQTDSVFTGLSPGNYYIVVADSNNTIYGDTIVLTEPGTVDLGADKSACEGDSVTLDAGDFVTYNWNDGLSTDSIITVDTSGMFYVDVTDTNGCFLSDTVNVTFYPLPVVNLGNDTVFCEGNWLMLDAGSGYIDYVWTDSLSLTQYLTVDSTGAYYVIVTDTNGCSNSSDTINITVQSLAVVELGNDTAFCEGDSIILQADSGFVDYLWVDLSTNQYLTVDSTGDYYVIVTDTNGCINSSDTINITVYSLPVVDLGNDTSFCGNNIVLDADNPGVAYDWSTGDTTQTILADSSGTYFVTVTNICGMIDDSIVIDLMPLPDVNLGNDTSICSGDTIILQADSSFVDYLWVDLSTNQYLTVDSTGAYYVVVTDTNGCSNSSDTINITVLSLPAVDLGNDTSFCNGNSIILDADNAGAAYDWSTSDTTQTILVDSSGTYYVTVSDICGTVTDSIIIDVIPLPVVYLGNDTAFCDGNSIILDADSGYADYLWVDSLSLNQYLTVDSTGAYYAIVTDTNGCSNSSDTINITVYSLPFVDIGNDTSFCDGDSIILIADSGFVDYVWVDSLSLTQYLTVTTPGAYYVDVTDTNSCSNSSDTINITVLPLPAVDLGNDTSFCEGNSITLDADNPGASYDWSTSDTTQTILADSSGIYYVTVTDICGTATDSIIIDVTPLPDVNLGNDTAFCEGDAFFHTLDAGAGYTYLWSDASTDQTLIAADSGTYFVEITDTNGCSNSDTINVTENPLPTVDLGLDTILTSLPDSITLDAGAGFDLYQWQDGYSNQTYNVSSYGMYSVTVTDINGCQASDSIYIDLIDEIQVKIINYKLKIHPNPAKDVFNLTIKTANKCDLTIELMTIQGQIVYSFNSYIKRGRLTHQIDVSEFAKGVYYLRVYSVAKHTGVKTKNGIRVKKLVIQ